MSRFSMIQDPPTGKGPTVTITHPTSGKTLTFEAVSHQNPDQPEDPDHVRLEYLGNFCFVTGTKTHMKQVQGKGENSQHNYYKCANCGKEILIQRNAYRKGSD